MVTDGYFLQVDPPSRFEPSKTEMRHHTGETELGEMQVITLPTNNIATSSLPSTTTSPHIGELSCRNGGCKVRRNRTEPRLESPWHTLKTIFLVSVIVAFLLWVIVYTLLDQYQILWLSADMIPHNILHQRVRSPCRSCDLVILDPSYFSSSWPSLCRSCIKYNLFLVISEWLFLLHIHVGIILLSCKEEPSVISYQRMRHAIPPSASKKFLRRGLLFKDRQFYVAVHHIRLVTLLIGEMQGNLQSEVQEEYSRKEILEGISIGQKHFCKLDCNIVYFVLF